MSVVVPMNFARILFLLSVVLFCNVTNKRTVLAVESEWKFNFVYEYGEYIGSNFPHLYWDFINIVSNKYQEIINNNSILNNLLTSLINPYDISFGELSAYNHEFIAKLNFFQKEFNKINKQSPCDYYFVIDESVLCDTEKLTHSLDSYVKSSIKKESFGHPLKSTSYHSIEILLFFDLKQEIKPDFNLLVDTFINNTDVNIYLVPISFNIDESSKKKSDFLTGYSMYFDIKNNEYKNVDDKKIKNDENDQLGDIVESKNEDNTQNQFLEGINFETLKFRFPNYDEKLENLRMFINEQQKEIVELKPWQTRDICVQTIQFIHNSKFNESDQYLLLMEEIAENYPVLQKTISNTKIDKNIKKSFTNTRKKYKIKDENNILIINGQIYSDRKKDIFKMFNHLHNEYNIVNNLMRTGISNRDAIDFIKKFQNEKHDLRLDLRSNTLIWLNNVEKDPEFSRFSYSYQIFDNFWPSQFAPIRRNIYNIIIVSNPFHPSFQNILNVVNQIISSPQVPLRFGVNLCLDKDASEDSIKMLHIFRYLSILSPKKALSFLIHRLQKPTYSLQEIYRLVGSMDFDDLLNQIDSTFHQKSMAFCSKIGVDLPILTFNGKILTKEDTSDLISALTNYFFEFQKKFIDLFMMQGIIDRQDGEQLAFTGEDIVQRMNNLLDPTKYQPKKIKIHQIISQIANVKYVFEPSDHQSFDTVWLLIGHFTPVSHRIISTFLSAFNDHKFRLMILFSNSTINHKWQQLFCSNLKDTDIFILENLFNNEEIEVDYVLSHLNMDSDVVFEQSCPNRVLSSMIFDSFNLFDDDSTHIFFNGKLFGPFNHPNQFISDDFHFIRKYHTLFSDMDDLHQIHSKSALSLSLSDFSLILSTIFNQFKESTSMNFKGAFEDKHSIVLPAASDSSPFIEINAILNPLSTDFSWYSTIIRVIYDSLNVHLEVLLDCPDKYDESASTKRFYKTVVASSKRTKALCLFSNLPQTPLLTLHIQTPESWMIGASSSTTDLDNLNLASEKNDVHASYKLEYVLIEGQVDELDNFNQHPGGLQLKLVSSDGHLFTDTIVMANLGYFQLKAVPGVYSLELVDGQSTLIYHISTVFNSKYEEINPKNIVVDDLNGLFLFVKVKHNVGYEDKSLFGNENDSSSSFWNQFSFFDANKEKSEVVETDDVINIFTVATGLLYERLLRVMILSVLKNTKTPVKFWFLKNYLSSNFINTIPKMANHYSFTYELVQYKWPDWLNGQTEKQRIIWGYKILFLDVLFPLNVKRVIFVDADQIVRADLQELNKMSLDGAPYAYTPFCDDKPEADGFRFWKRGYWKDLLRGRPYHISALYVIDLKKFRKMMTGDRLRQQYQSLSYDPNSLSNLDQDLPNNMIHSVPIKSLPQEWLWCEAWCSNKSKAKAKTIDLCNDPMTKESKLDRAMRIAPEWSVYDDEINNFLNFYDNSQTEKTVDRTQSQTNPPVDSLNGGGYDEF